MNTVIPKKENVIEEDFVVNPREFFFSGGMEYLPMTISAASIEEATEIWEKKKVPVNEDINLSEQN